MLPYGVEAMTSFTVQVPRSELQVPRSQPSHQSKSLAASPSPSQPSPPQPVQVPRSQPATSPSPSQPANLQQQTEAMMTAPTPAANLHVLHAKDDSFSLPTLMEEPEIQPQDSQMYDDTQLQDSQIDSMAGYQFDTQPQESQIDTQPQDGQIPVDLVDIDTQQYTDMLRLGPLYDEVEQRRQVYNRRWACMH